MEAPSAEDRVFELLRREDKYCLGGGDGVIFTPPMLLPYQSRRGEPLQVPVRS